MGQVTSSIGADLWCIATADPATLLMSDVLVNGHPGADPRFFEVEYAADDGFSQRNLARSTEPAAGLSLLTGGEPHRSVFWRELLEPFGIGDQVRAALMTPRGCVGYVGLMRDASSRPFSADEVETLRSVSASLARGLRLTAIAPPPGEQVDASGLVLLADDLTLLDASPSMRDLLQHDLHLGSLPPPAILAVAVRTRGGTDAFARVSIDGRWITLDATSLHAGVGGTRIAVIVRRTARSEIAEVLLRREGLTEREIEIVGEILYGRSTREIAARLHLSPFTVQQHLKSIFDKMGVRSRREIVAQVFIRHYSQS